MAAGAARPRAARPKVSRGAAGMGVASMPGTRPKRAARAGSEKTRAIPASIGVRFPVQCAHMLARCAVAILPVLRADAVTILCDFSGDPVRLGKSGNHVAYQLRLADAACVTANDDYTPAMRAAFFIWRQVEPQVF